ncbi:MAG: GNAT family N-acetyltransferase [Actinomycetes bacterium]
MSAVEVRVARADEAAAAARLHCSRITEGFLPTLGPAFLARLYRRTVLDPHSFLLVAEREGAVVGMAAGTEGVGALYRTFILRDGIAATLRALPRVLRALGRVVETLRYPGGDGGTDLPAAEVLAVAVDRDAAGRGVGRLLVEAAVAEFTRRGVAAVKVVAGAGNEPALGLYRATGFVDAATVEVHAGTPSVVLVRSLP